MSETGAARERINSLLFPEDTRGYIELRALPTGEREFFRPCDADGVKRFVREHAARNLFFGVAARKTMENGTAQNCGSLNALFADLDFKSTPEDAVRAKLATFPLPPSIIVSSGGGLHCYWLLRELADVQEEFDQLKTLLRRLARCLGGDLAAAEPARILRIPGTLNYKYDPPRRVTLESVDSARRYNLSDFDDFLPEEPEGEPGGDRFQVPETIPEGERNDTLYRLARSLKARRMSSEAILAALREENRIKCVPPLDAEELDTLAHNALRQPDRETFLERRRENGEDIDAMMIRALGVKA